MTKNVNCETCNAGLYRNKSQIKASKTKIFFCNKYCRSKWDSKKHKNNRVEFKCSICGNTEMMTPSALKNKKFCSLKCLGIHNSNEGNTIVNCDYCKSKFSKINSKISNNNFCTKKCSTKWFSENTNIQVTLKCFSCEKDFKVGNNRKDTAKTCSIKCHYEYIKHISTEGHMKDILIENGLKSVESMKMSETLPEKIVRNYLIDNNIPFESQKRMYDKFIVDFYLYESNIVLEVYGDYWHANPIKYGEEENKIKMNKHQIKQIGKDKARKNYLEKCGHKFVIAWENDIYKDINNTMKQIIN